MMLPAVRVFGVVEPGQTGDRLSAMCSALLTQQRGSWPMCRDGYASLEHVRTRSLGLHRYALHLQYNPGRMVSTGAKVDPASIRQRRCFLCVPHLPPEQHAVRYGQDLLILCNPVPIFSRHLTISHQDHRPQELGPFIDVMIRLAKDLSPDYCIFYNGPRCGASAPDHFHFQAAPKETIPVVNESMSDRRTVVRQTEGVEISTLPDYDRTVAIFRSPDVFGLAHVFGRFTEAWKRLDRSEEEPMMNVLCVEDGGGSRLIVFLRRKHRPDAYFLEGEAQMLVSPAAVDIGGLVITPREKEFNGLTSGSVSAIFREVSAEPSLIEQICGSLT